VEVQAIRHAAGDAFAGRPGAALADGLPLTDAARVASGVAALATAALGAQTAPPQRRERQAFLEQATSTTADIRGTSDAAHDQ
jgi:sugar/nucleoside kinase (ribokinase family)